MDIKNILKFKNFINSNITKINKHNTRTTANITFKDVIYYTCQIIGNNISYDLENTQLQIEDILNVSKSSLIYNKKKFDHEHFTTLNDSIVEYMYSENKPRILAVDGTYVILSKKLNEYGFEFQNEKKEYCQALISTIFDVEKNSN